jgi:quinol monooxygenase YgiN
MSFVPRTRLLRNLALQVMAAVLAVAALASSPAPAEEKSNPIVDRVKASLKDPSRPFTMLVQLRVKADAGPKLEAAFVPAARATRKEKGNLAYQLNRDVKTPTRYLVYECWRDLPALEAHLKSEYITSLLKDLGELLDGPPEVQILIPTGE